MFLPLFVVLTLFLANWVLIKTTPPAAPWGKCKVCGVTGAYEEIAMPSPFHKRFCISMHFDTSFCLVVCMMHLCYALRFSVERWAILREAGPALPICNRLNLPLARVKVGRCHFCGVADGAVPGGHHQVGAQNKFEQWKKSRLLFRVYELYGGRNPYTVIWGIIIRNPSFFWILPHSTTNGFISLQTGRPNQPVMPGEMFPLSWGV